MTSETSIQWSSFLSSFRDENRSVRKRGLQNIRKELLSGPEPAKDIIISFLTDPAATELLKLFTDPVENIREKSGEIFCELFENLTSSEDGHPELRSLMMSIIPVIVQRLGQNQLVEQSEEIRLILIKILHNVVKIGAVTSFSEPDESSKRNASMVLVYLDEILQILVQTIVDPYPEVKKESCYCAKLVAKSLPRGYFPEKSPCLIKPLLLTLSHQHYKVRALVVETIGEVIMYGSGKSVPDVISHLAQRLFDKAPQVRSATVSVIGNWLLDLPDRYSFHYQLMPLLLTGLSDELEEIRSEADGLWHDVGIKYQRENEDDLKDDVSFGDLKPSHYSENVERPPLGCRKLMYHHMSKILVAANNDLGDWVADTRVKASQLLYYLILNAEGNCTQHLEKLLTAFYKACADDELQIRANALKAAQLAGTFVEVEVWTRLVLPRLESGSCEVLMTLAALIRGSLASGLEPHLDAITEKLSKPELCQSVTLKYQMNLLDVMDALVSVAKDSIRPYGLRVFEISMTLLALQASPSVQEETVKLLNKFASCGFGDLNGVYDAFTRLLVEQLAKDCHDWNPYSVEAKIFGTLLLEADSVSFSHLDVALPIFKVNLDVEKSPELRVNLLTVMSKMLTKAAEEPNLGEVYRPYVDMVVNELILPNLIWRAGRTAAAVRSSAIACLWCFMKLGLGEIGQLFNDETILSKILPMLQDDNQFSRMVTCKVLKSIFYTFADKKVEHLSNEFLKALLALLKVLDDPANDIRIAGCETMSAYIECFKNRSDFATYSGHIEEIINGLLIHLDDPVPKVEESVAGVLKEVAQLDPVQMKDKLTAARSKHRNVRPCDELLKYIKELNL